jgi:oligopeptide/dipeptide ABC transporter ATP-binding protein
MSPVLEVDSVDVVLGRRRRATRILADVSVTVGRGEIVGVVGETGSGKTTLARTIVGLVDPVRGRVAVAGEPVSELGRSARRVARRRGLVQLVFQDPLRSLDPDLTVGRLVGEGLAVRGGLRPTEIRERVLRALDTVGLDRDLDDRYPAQVSGGQRQRVAIARALVMEPELLICDEPVSALDASNRNRILLLLDELRRTLDLAVVVISHDLASLAAVADRIVVLYRGRVVEQGPTEQVFGEPRHPYTALLVASAPSLTRQHPLAPAQLRRLVPVADPLGANACVFSSRCRFATAECASTPALVDVDTRQVACHHHKTWRNQLNQPVSGELS